MKKAVMLAAATACAAAAHAQLLQALLDSFTDAPEAAPAEETAVGELTVSGAYMAADRTTGALVATGGVTAAAAPYRFRADSVTRSADGEYNFTGHTFLTTCTNDDAHVHWNLTGDFRYLEQRAAIVKNAWVKLWDVPVFWLPYWYYPLNTDYGFRAMPGYTSRWGGYLLTGYVYNLWGEDRADGASLGGSTYADFRTKNGVALGQTVRWNLGDFGKGRFKAYYAWDEDYDRYTDHWSDRKHRYRNWGSDVDRDRYRLTFDHHADFTERDSLRIHASYFSDSWMQRDFFERDERGESIPTNEAFYEHRENDWSLGGSVAGPLNDFYGGVARLPEGWLDIAPQPLWTLPVNYESQTRGGYLNRNYARYPYATAAAFRHAPYLGPDGRAADYQAFRADSAHRLTAPFKLWDVLSVVPRAVWRGTYWSDSGDARALLEEDGRSRASGEPLFRNIAEFGFTAAARGSAWLDEKWRHTVEPYVDYSFQRANTTGGRGSRRPYVFDAYDASTEWLDQFGFEGRGLPCNWHGIRPGLRNIFQREDDDGFRRSVLDADLYAAVPFEAHNRYDRADDGLWRGWTKNKDDPRYSRRDSIVPGTRVRFNPTKKTSLSARAEYDCDNEKVGYADVIFRHFVTTSFNWHFGYIGRDHRIWDYAPSALDRWNWEYDNLAEIGFEHTVCDRFAWSPYLRYDCRANELDEIGSWFDILTDCLGFRVMTAFEDSYERIDGSKRRSDFRVGFFIYLRAFGPSSMLDLIRF